jgi:hypothetical protein
MKHWFSGVRCKACNTFNALDDLGLNDEKSIPAVPLPASDLIQNTCFACGKSSSYSWAEDQALNSVSNPSRDLIDLRSQMSR